MAATGLLGINPYRKGVAVDISSKPTSLYIDIQNKERARTDALDRYFMDYDKNINPAGMKANDIDYLTKLQQESKGFYFQNKKAIQNPMLDGGKAYNQFVNYNKQQLALVSQSKDAAARGRVGGTAVAGARAKGFVIGDKTFEDLKANEAPVLSKGYRPFDAATFDAYKPFSAEELQKDLYTGNKFLSQKVIGKKSIGGKDVETTELSYDPINNKAISTITSGKYQYDKGFAYHVDKISENANELAALNPIYKKYYGSDIEIINGRANPKQVADALAISLSPYERKEAFKQYNPYYSAGAREQPSSFNPDAYVGSMLQSGLPLNESNIKDILSQTDVNPLEANTILTKYPNSVVIAALPEQLASKYVETGRRGTTYKPDIILMDKTNQNIILGFENNGKLNFQVKPRNVLIADVTAGAGVTATKQVYSGTAPKTEPTTIKYIVNGKVYNIPKEEANEFLKQYPNAKKG
jgi:hypothetical protein